jgi:hypothetical protein
MLVPPLNKVAREKGFNALPYFNEIMRVSLSGLSVHVDQMKENPFPRWISPTGVLPEKPMSS